MTTKEQQCALILLGYDPGAVDGVFGRATDAAIRQFQRDAGITADGVCGHDTEQHMILWISTGKRKPKDSVQQPAADTAAKPIVPTVAADGNFWSSIKYFVRNEFRCPCGRCGGFPAEPKEALIRAADRIRSAAGRQADVSSGVRCRAHNDELPNSATNSRHLTGGAMDFRIRGMSSSELLVLARQQPEIKYSYAINDTYIHMDVGY